MLRIAFAACLLMVSAACAQLPRAELQAYRDSFKAAETAAQPMIADYAVAERSELLAALQASSVMAGDREVARYDPASHPYFETFIPGDATHASDADAVSTIGLPPGASAVDRAFRGIAAYNDTLVALAENRNVEEARGQLRQIISDVGGIVPGSEAPVAIAQQVSSLLVDIFRPAIEADNGVQFRQKVIDGHRPMIGLLDLLIAHSEDQYATTISPYLDRIEQGASNRAELIAKVNAWHRIFGNYVVLLRAMKERLTELKDAAENPRSAPLLARASSGAAELRAYADTLRHSIEALRALP